MTQYLARTVVILIGLLGLAGGAGYPAVPGCAYGPYPYCAGAYPYVVAPEVLVSGGLYGRTGWSGGYHH